MNLGLFAGIIIGALPGLTATLGVALLMPLTFGMDMVPGIVLLLGVYCGGIYGGSITGDFDQNAWYTLPPLRPLHLTDIRWPRTDAQAMRWMLR